MARKRTGLQCKISSIFSQVPVPKKVNQRSASSSSESQYQGPDSSKSTVPKRQAPALLLDPQTTESHHRITSNHVREIKVPEQRSIHILTKKAKRRRNKNFGSVAGSNSKRQRMGLALLFILSCLLVVILIRHFNTHKPKRAHLELVGDPISKALAKPHIEIKWPKPQKYPSNIRDPMKLQEFERPGLIVRGIVTIEGRLFAIIGGELVRESETVRGAKITKIYPDSVQFEMDGRKWIEAKTSDLVVKGIVVGEDRPKALIGIQLVEEGKKIFGVTVVRISHSYVEFEMDDKTWTQEVEGDKK